MRRRPRVASAFGMRSWLTAPRRLGATAPARIKHGMLCALTLMAAAIQAASAAAAVAATVLVQRRHHLQSRRPAPARRRACAQVHRWRCQRDQHRISGTRHRRTRRRTRLITSARTKARRLCTGRGEARRHTRGCTWASAFCTRRQPSAENIASDDQKASEGLPARRRQHRWAARRGPRLGMRGECAMDVLQTGGAVAGAPGKRSRRVRRGLSHNT